MLHVEDRAQDTAMWTTSGVYQKCLAVIESGHHDVKAMVQSQLQLLYTHV